MALSAESIPMRWPAGPLEIARRKNTKGFSAETAEVLRNWLDPVSLAIVQGTPVNCLVVSWAAGLPEDAEQQHALKPLIEKGKQAGLEFVGLIEGDANRPAAIAAAKSAGLSAVALDGDPPANAGITVIPRNESTKLRQTVNSPIVGVSDGLWPGIPQDVNQAGGPTNLPWVDSNLATLRIARALTPGKGVWIDFDPPQAAPPSADAYMLAVADPASYGARWVISLDDALRAGLTAKKQPAVDTWKKVATMLAFFEQHKQARTYQPAGSLAVVSNFAGSDWNFGEESLNLLPRLRESSQVIARSRTLGASLEGLQAIFYVDDEPPGPKLRQKLTDFAKDGGILFVPSKWPNPEGTHIQAEPYLLFNLRALGKGRLAVCKDDSPDVYDTVADIQNIISHRNDLLRLYNASSMNFFYQTSAQGKQGVIHLLNYSRRPASDGPLIFVKKPYRSARLVSPELPSPVELKWAPQEAGGAELSLPKISVYGAVELES
jgi:hypothetical protein